MTTNLFDCFCQLCALQWAVVRDDILVEDRDAAQGTALPLGIVLLELGVHGLQERTNEGLLESRANNAPLVQKVANCRSQLRSARKFDRMSTAV